MFSRSTFRAIPSLLLVFATSCVTALDEEPAAEEETLSASSALEFGPMLGPTHAIRQVSSNNCARFSGGSSTAGSSTELWACSSARQLSFAVTPAGTVSGRKVYSFRNLDTNNCLDVLGSRRTANTAVIQYRCTGASNQSFFIENVEDDIYVLRAAHSGLVLSSAGGSGTAGTQLVQATYTGAASQKWRLPGRFAASDHPRLLVGPGDQDDVLDTTRTEKLSAEALHYWKIGNTAGLRGMVGELLTVVNTMYANPGELSDVELGRDLGDAMLAYDFMAAADVFTERQRTTLANQALTLARLAVGGTAIPYTNRLSTWAMPAWMGAAAAFPEDPRSAALLQEASAAIDDYLAPVPYRTGNPTIHEDGVWAYSPHYASGAAGQLVPAMVMLKRNAGVNYLSDPRFKDALRKLYNLRTPPNVLNNNYVRLPGFGDTFNPWNDGLRSLAWVASAVSDVDRAVSAELMGVWRAFGGLNDGQTYNVFTPAFAEALTRPGLAGTTPAPLSSGRVSSIATVFRQNVGTSNEDYMLMLTPAPGSFGHQHDDRGSINIFYNRVPLLLDSGTQCYGCPGQVYDYSALSNNKITFLDASGADRSWNNLSWAMWNTDSNPMPSGDTVFRSSSALDFVSSPIYSRDARSWVRQVALLRGAYETYLVWDQLDSDYRSVNNLHFLASRPADLRSTTWATVHGYNNIDVEVQALSPSGATLRRDACDTSAMPGACGFQTARGKWTPANTMPATLEWLKFVAPAGGDQLIAISPHAAGAPSTAIPRFTSVTVSPRSLGDTVKAWRIQLGTAPSRVVLVNSTTSEQTLTLPGTGNYTELLSGTSYSPGAVRVPAGRLTVFSQAGT